MLENGRTAVGNLKITGIESIPLFIYRDLADSVILKQKRNQFLILHPARIMKYTSPEMIKFHQPRGINLRLVRIFFSYRWRSQMA